MQIYGFQKTTLLDYPEHVAATVFTGGCNFRCPFCQNAGLVLHPEQYERVTEVSVLGHLEKRKGVLEGICITGGEPTLQPDLEDFIREIKDMGYLVKLDTNGFKSEVLENLLGRNLLDYVAMDIKASRENYKKVTGVSEIGSIEKSVQLLLGGPIPYEFRTTVVKGLHTVEEFEQIGEWIAGSRAYFIQNYSAEGEILNPQGLESFTKIELEKMVELVQPFVKRVELRGI